MTHLTPSAKRVKKYLDEAKEIMTVINGYSSSELDTLTLMVEIAKMLQLEEHRKRKYGKTNE